MDALRRWWFGPQPLGRIAALRVAVYLFAWYDVFSYSPDAVDRADVPASYRPLEIEQLLHTPTPTHAWAVFLRYAVPIVATLAATGRAPRLLGGVTFLLYFNWIVMGDSYGYVPHDRVGFLIALAVLPTVGAARRGDETRSERAGWALRCIQIGVIATYVLSAWAKLRFAGLDWANGGVMTWAILRRGTSFGRHALDHPQLLHIGQWLAFAAEFFSPVVLFLRGRLLYLAVASMFAFHLFNEAALRISFLPHVICILAFLPLERIWPALTGRRTRALLATGATLLTTVGGSTEANAAPGPTPARVVTLTIPAPHGEIPPRWLSYPGTPRTNVLLPEGYDPHRRYPLLVLLNALANNYDSYVEDGIVARIEAARLNAIVVMPEGGSGWYADWWNGGKRGAPAWESYELDTVLPTILQRFPIRPERRFHAIAGFSMGGLGAVYLAGRLPGFFGSAASLSGFVDPQYVSPVAGPAMGLLGGAHPLQEGLTPVYGPPYGFYADGHNPTKLAANLRQTRIFERTGTGVVSGAGFANSLAGDPNATVADAYGSALESLIINEMSAAFHRALARAGVDVTYQVHAGGHDLPDFYNEFKAYLAWGLFRAVPSHPAAWTNDTVASHGKLWDVSYRFRRAPTRVVRFHRSGDRLSISAAGSAVTLRTAGGCRLRTPTPATVRVETECRHSSRTQ
jgi:S-formylglutathione hydrolase FrmB